MSIINRVNFTPRTATRIERAVKTVESAPINQRGTYTPPPAISQTATNVNVYVNSNTGTGSTGIYAGTLAIGTANASSGTSITGLSAGANVIIYNGVEIASPAPNAQPYIKTSPAPVIPGTVIGKDSTTGYPIVLVSAVSVGC